eukprot:scaffold258594_cov45-Prasinocladus_malaysianus.AAC.1
MPSDIPLPAWWCSARGSGVGGTRGLSAQSQNDLGHNFEQATDGHVVWSRLKVKIATGYRSTSSCQCCPSGYDDQ